ncbi:hypothetical protein [Patulibacter defluvii]|uniref:hypothetical protein n=1 Tax=Patulibacter defluvii TaxID=3095358 RepID=UPI002A74EDCE|nr:hypothetical protein [Patulibacter sp. DM4]
MREDQLVATVRRQRGAISIRQLIAGGVSRRAVQGRVAARRLFPVLRGVYACGPHLDPWGWRYAAVLHAGGDALDGRVVLSHWSAAVALGLCGRAPATPHVSAVGRGGRRTSAVAVHRIRELPRADLDWREGLPLTSAARAILDVAALPSTNLDDLQRLLREGQYQRLLPADGLAAVLDRHPHHAGRRRLRQLDPELWGARSGRESPLEDELAALLAGLPLPPPERQLPVTGASGRRYRADVAWPAARLLVEADGRGGHGGSAAFEGDRDRDGDLLAAGWTTLRVTRVQLRRSPATVAHRIVATHDRGALGTEEVRNAPWSARA